MKQILSAILILIALQFSFNASYAETYKDAVGREVVIDHDPVRIVTLAPSLTEIVFYLGLGERVVGVTKFSYYPPEALEKSKVGSYIDLNSYPV